MKVIIISTVGLIYDGITSVILSYLQAMDKTGLEIYVVGTIEVKPKIKKTLSDLGCNIVELPSRRKHVFSYFIKLIRLISKEKVNVMHAHGNSGTLAIEMLAGWIAGCKKRIAHSHNTRCEQVVADRILRPIFYVLYTDAVACGMEAGKWLFKEKKFLILKNGRDIDKYKYNSNIRTTIREKYGLGNALTIGHVGGFVEQKNHRFLLQIYNAILNRVPSARFIMVGDGVLREEIEEMSKQYGIYDRIIFTGNIDNVPEVLQAMDGMLLPSLFEGLPLVAIEWQISGIPCVLSDVVTKECKLVEKVSFLSLDAPCEVWADEILMMVKDYDRESSSFEQLELIREKGFDIKNNADVLKKMYLY